MIEQNVVRGWTGDTSKELVGRLHNQLIIHLEDYMSDLRRGIALSSGIPLKDPLGSPLYWYQRIRVVNLSIGMRRGIVTKVSYSDDNLSVYLRIAMAHIDNTTAWKPGIHLFSVYFDNSPEGPDFHTVATAVIDSTVQTLDRNHLVTEKIDRVRAMVEGEPRFSSILEKG